MVLHQTVNLRNGYAIVAGDSHTQQAYEAECERARAKQTTRYAVAPRVAVTLHDHTRLGPGEAVTIRMFRADGEVPAWHQLERLVLRGLVLENTDINDEPDEATMAPTTGKAAASRTPAGRTSTGGSGAPSAA